MSGTIRYLKQAVGKQFKDWHFSDGGEYLLLQFEGGILCQIVVRTSAVDDPWLEQSLRVRWEDYNEHDLVKSGVLTAEWVAQQNAEKQAEREARQRESELAILAELKAKYEQNG